MCLAYPWSTRPTRSLHSRAGPSNGDILHWPYPPPIQILLSIWTMQTKPQFCKHTNNPYFYKSMESKFRFLLMTPSNSPRNIFAWGSTNKLNLNWPFLPFSNSKLPMEVIMLSKIHQRLKYIYALCTQEANQIPPPGHPQFLDHWIITAHRRTTRSALKSEDHIMTPGLVDFLLPWNSSHILHG